MRNHSGVDSAWRPRNPEVSIPAYKLEDLRPRRETLAEIPPNAPMRDDLVIGYWNGREFVSWVEFVFSSQPRAATPSDPLATNSETKKPAEFPSQVHLFTRTH